jgi:steroid delta-isomerase-like uncharacterized protein
MSTDTVERLERLFGDVWNAARPDTADELVHESYHIHDRGLADELSGPALYRALAEGTREAFPDAEFVVEDTLADGDRVALRWTMTGTHEGDLFGVPPTGRQVELTAIEIDRFADGRLIETWTQSDQLGLMRQVGALPEG